MENKRFLNPVLVVDVVVFTIEDGQLKVLLVKRENDPFKNMHALPGGYLLEDETTRKAATRILAKKAGVRDVYMEQLYTFDGSARDPRGPVFSVAYLALVPSPLPLIRDKKLAPAAVLVNAAKLPKLAFDHRNIISYAVERLRGKLEYTTIGFNALPKLFTLSQLQQVYEVILGKKLDKRNFRKKIEQLGFLKETKHVLTGMKQRPAKLYALSAGKGDLKIF